MVKSLKESLEGTGIGLLGGIVIGISEADWLRLAIALALIAYAGKNLKRTESGSSGHSDRITFTGIAAFIAVVIGLYINGQQLFIQPPNAAITAWIDAGYSPSQARVLYLKNMQTHKEKNRKESPLMQSLIHTIITPASMDSLSPGKDSILNN